MEIRLALTEVGNSVGFKHSPRIVERALGAAIHRRLSLRLDWHAEVWMQTKVHGHRRRAGVRHRDAQRKRSLGQRHGQTQHEVEGELAAAFSQLAPTMIGNDYLVVGTVETKFWKHGMKGTTELSNTLDHVADFRKVYNLTIQPAGWYPADQK